MLTSTDTFPRSRTFVTLTGSSSHQFNQEFEQRSPHLGSTASFNTCSHVKIFPMHHLYPSKIVHDRAFCMGTCAKGGDSAQPRAKLSNLQDQS